MWPSTTDLLQVLSVKASASKNEGTFSDFIAVSVPYFIYLFPQNLMEIWLLLESKLVKMNVMQMKVTVYKFLTIVFCRQMKSFSWYWLLKCSTIVSYSLYLAFWFAIVLPIFLESFGCILRLLKILVEAIWLFLARPATLNFHRHRKGKMWDLFIN